MILHLHAFFGMSENALMSFDGKCMQMAHELDRYAHIDTMAAAIDFVHVS